MKSAKITQFQHLGLVLNVCLRLELENDIKELLIGRMKFKELPAQGMKK